MWAGDSDEAMSAGIKHHDSLYGRSYVRSNYRRLLAKSTKL